MPLAQRSYLTINYWASPMQLCLFFHNQATKISSVGQTSFPPDQVIFRGSGISLVLRGHSSHKKEMKKGTEEY
jgi:hypothetical protein